MDRVIPKKIVTKNLVRKLDFHSLRQLEYKNATKFGKAVTVTARYSQLVLTQGMCGFQSILPMLNFATLHNSVGNDWKVDCFLWPRPAWRTGR